MRAELVHDASAGVGEAPLWCADTGELLWVDIYAGVLHRFDPATGRSRTQPVPGPVGTLALADDGGLVHGAADRVVHLDADGTARHLVTLPTGDRTNDGACDPSGRMLVGSFTEDRRPGACGLYRLEPEDDGWRAEPVVTGITLSNGVDWSPDGERMYYVDTPTLRVDVWDYDIATGTAHDRRCFVDLADGLGRPDGVCVDAEGGLWVALVRSGTLHRYSAEGLLTEVHTVPTPWVTAVAFGGPDLTQLYVTSAKDLDGGPDVPQAGGLFRIDPGLAGRPPVPWRVSPGQSRTDTRRGTT